MRNISSKGGKYKSVCKRIACMALTTCVLGDVHNTGLVVSASEVVGNDTLGVVVDSGDNSKNKLVGDVNSWIEPVNYVDITKDVAEDNKIVTDAMKTEESTVEKERLEMLKVVESITSEENKKIDDKNKQERQAEDERRRKEEETRRLEEERREAERKEQEEKNNTKASVKESDNDQGTSLKPAVVDPNYTGSIVTVTGEDRDILERLVMGEAGGEGYLGACLVAQCIRDTMVEDNVGTVEQVRRGYGYTGSLSRKPNSDVKRAVEFIFDQGGYAVKHKIHYFYAFKWCTSRWHETQQFVIQHGGHRFFDRW